MAQRMSESFQKAPHFYLGVEVNADKLVQFPPKATRSLRSINRSKNLTYTDLFLRALSLALQGEPQVNAYWGSEGIQSGDSVDVGFAVQAATGLVVPVIRKADQLSLLKIGSRTPRLDGKG